MNIVFLRVKATLTFLYNKDEYHIIKGESNPQHFSNARMNHTFSRVIVILKLLYGVQSVKLFHGQSEFYMPYVNDTNVFLDTT